jgi:hypothetical protein
LPRAARRDRVLSVTLAPSGSAAADMNKTLRVSFQVAETGFDPQAISDLYSEFVNRHIFDALYYYDYLARPYKLVPNTGRRDAGDQQDGLTWTIRIRKGVYFAPDPVFNNQKRELTADDYIYAWKRLLDPKVRSPYLFFVEDKFAGADAVIEQAKKTGQVRLRREVRGLKALDRYTIRFTLKTPDLRAAAQPDADADGRGRARSDRKARGARKRLDDEQPGRHRPVCAEGMEAREQDRSRGQSEFPRRDLSRKRGPRRSRDHGADEGQEDSGDRPQSISASSKRTIHGFWRSRPARSITRSCRTR